jgi:hypothetical protein
MSQENVEIVRGIYTAWRETGFWAASGDLDPGIE